MPGEWSLCDAPIGSARTNPNWRGSSASGPPGVGKSHVATTLAVGAIRAFHRALIRSTFDLAADVAHADATGTRRELVQQLPRVDLPVLEDFGIKKLGATAAEDLLEIFVRRHEAVSTLTTANRSTNGASSSGMSRQPRRFWIASSPTPISCRCPATSIVCAVAPKAEATS